MVVASNTEVDVVILGTGPAGMAAAIVAKTRGLQPLLLEKTDQVGGTAAWSAGMMWFANTHAMQRAGFADSPERARRYFAARVGDSASEQLQEAYIHHGQEALAYLVAQSELRVIAVDYPDYYPESDGGMFGRAHAPLAFDGRLLGKNFGTLRGPIAAFAPLGGMMLNFEDIGHFMAVTRSAKSAWHVGKLLIRHGLDRLGHGRGTRLVNGNALVGRLYKTILDHQTPVWLRTQTQEIVIENSRAAGVVVVAEGKTLSLRARCGVIVATGGYPSSIGMRAANSRSPTTRHAIALPENVGDGIALACAAGGRLVPKAVDADYYVPVSELNLANGETTNWGHWALDRAKPGFIAVGPNGKRFANEAASYHEFTLRMFEAGAIPAYLIADAAAVKTYGIGAVLPGGMRKSKLEKAGYLQRGGTIAELASKINVDTSELERTVARVNGFARTGIDEDFGKGQSAYDTFFADPAHLPNPCLGTIETGPFYAVKMMPGDFGTSRGLVTGVNGEVLDGNNAPIPGLFACGNDMNSPVGGRYIGAGITLGPALTFGYLAAMALATTKRPN